MLHVMGENISAEILSVAPLQSADRLASIGRTLGAFPEFVPTKMGPNDPPRTRVTPGEEVLSAWASAIHPGDYYTQFLKRSR